MGSEVSVMDGFIANITSLVTAAISWMGNFWTEISSDPILLTVVIGIPLIGLGIGLLTRLIRV